MGTQPPVTHEDHMTCPNCGVDIPIPHTIGGYVTDQGLASSFDLSYAEEHLKMHQSCTCDWTPTDGSHIRIIDPTCGVHQ